MNVTLAVAAVDVTLTASIIVLAGTVVTALLGYLGIKKTLKTNQPVTDATADEKQAGTNKANLESQQGVIRILREQVDRQDIQIQDITERLEKRDDQNELLEAQLRDCRAQTAMLRESAAAMNRWMRDHYTEEHPGKQPPMQFLSFES